MVRGEKQKPDVRLAIAVPTYNEANNLQELIARIKTVVAQAGIPSTVLIIDDNSPDGTGEVAELLAKTVRSKDITVRVLHRAQKDGLGTAYIAGFQELLKQDFTHILEMDADLSHDPKYIPALAKAAGRADLVVGSRYVPGGATPDWGIRRKLLSRFGNLYARIFLGNRVHDYTGGFNLYAKSLLKKLDIGSLQTSGYDFQIELKYRAIKQGVQVVEVPIKFVDRVHGTSKIPKSTISKTLLLVPRLRLFQ